MITNKVFRATKDVVAPFEIKIKKGDELEVVNDVVYMGGYPLPPNLQQKIYDWLVISPDFKDDTRKF